MASTLSLSELKQYNGVDREKIYVALKGTVFDVTHKGGENYGPGGPYAMFAGRDMSRAMACTLMEVKDDPDDLCDLDPEQVKNLDSWYEKFKEKYPVVGKVVP